MQQDRDANAPETGGTEGERTPEPRRTGEGAASALARLKEQHEKDARSKQAEEPGDDGTRE